MKPGFIALIVVGSVLTIAGATLFAVGIANEYKNETLITHDYEIEGEINNFNFDLDTANVEFKVSQDGKNKVVCIEKEKNYHEVTFTDNTLNIKAIDNSSWYDNFFHFGVKKMSVEVYLTGTDYQSLNLKASTGDVTIGQDFNFEDFNMNLSTGNATLACKVNNEIKVETSTGDIVINDVQARSGNFKASTGNVKLKNNNYEEGINIITSTGDIKLENVNAKNYASDCSTGKVRFDNVTILEHVEIKTSTGDISLYDSDAGSLNLKASTGDVKATFLTNKIVYAESSSGKINIPHLTEGGICNIKTSTGDIIVTIKE